MSGTLHTKAWLMWRGALTMRYNPGVLQLADGRLSFTASSWKDAGPGQMTRRQLRALEQAVQKLGLAEKMNKGEEVQVLDVSLDQVDEVIFPWYSFDAYLILGIGGTKFRFSFVPPSGGGGSDPGNIVDVIESVGEIAGSGGEILRGRRAGNAWRAALSTRL